MKQALYSCLNILCSWSTHVRIAALFLVFSLVFGGTQSFALAQPSQTINYQGKLTDTTGAAVINGQYNMRFWLVQTLANPPPTLCGPNS